MAGWSGAAMLCYVTPKEHLGLPDEERRQTRRDRLQDRRPRGRRRAASPRRSGPRRCALQSALRIRLERTIPAVARSRNRQAYHDETLPQDTFKSAHFCSMCGPKYCSMKITEDIREMAQAGNLVEMETPDS